MKFTKEETTQEVLRLHGEGQTLIDIAAELNRKGHTNGWGNELSPQNLSMILKRAEEETKVKQRRVVVMPALPADAEGERAQRLKTPKNPSESKAILAQQILQTKEIDIGKRFVMAAEILMS